MTLCNYNITSVYGTRCVTKHMYEYKYVNFYVKKVKKVVLSLNIRIRKGYMCIIMIIIAAWFFFFTQTQVYASSGSNNEDEYSSAFFQDEINKLENTMNKFASEDAQKIFPELNLREIIENKTNANPKNSLMTIINNIVQYVIGEVYLNIQLLIKIITIAVLCALLKNIQLDNENKGNSELAFFVCYIALVLILVISIKSLFTDIIATVSNMTGFMYAIIPILIAILLSGGNVVTTGIFQPIMIILIEIIGTLFKTVIVPMVLFSTILFIINNISEKVQISGLAKLIKQLAVWMTGILLTVFATVVMAQGFVGGVSDGVALKTTKFALKTFIPVAGGYLSDATEAVMGSMLIIRNSIGIALMVGIVSVCLIPILKLLAIILLYKIAGALIEPISDKRIIKCIESVSDSLSTMLGILAGVTFMFLLSVVIVIGVINTSWSI